MTEPKKTRRGRGEGTIVQRGKNSWYAQLSTPNGRIHLSGKTKKHVQDLMRVEYAKQSIPKPVAVNEKMTVLGFFDYWLRDVVAPSVSQATHATHSRNVRLWILPMLGKINLDDLDFDCVNSVLANVLKSGCGGPQRNMVRNILSRALRHAIERGYIQEDPCTATVRSRKADTEQQVYTKEQAVTFLTHCRGERLAALWQTAIQTGMRIGELLALQPGDIDLPGGVIHVRRTQTLIENGSRIAIKSPKTKAGLRSITIGKTLQTQLKEHFKRRQTEGNQESEWVFCDPSGAILSRGAEPRTSFRRVLKNSGLPRIRPHDLRHTHATLLLADGENVKVVSERLGHSSIEITIGTYGHVLPNMHRDAASRVDRLFS